VSSHRTLPVIAERFTIGGVCLLAGRALARRWPSIMALCLAAGAAVSAFGLLAFLRPGAFMTEIMAAPWPVLEIARGLVPSIIAGPVIALSLLALTKPSQPKRYAYVLVLRRLPATTMAAMCMSLLASEPARFAAAALGSYHPGVQLAAVVALFFYQIAMFALGYLMLTVMVVESPDPWHALKRAIRLIHRRWIRVSVIVLCVWGLTYAADQFGTSMILSIGLDSFWWASVIASVSAAIRIATILVVIAAIYHLLRNERDGPRPQDAAAVFD
jgi:hypothetical protein